MGRYLTGDLKPLSELTDQYRVFHEESADYAPRDEKPDFEELRGTLDTRIYVWGAVDGVSHCCVSTENNRIYERLSRIAGVTRYSGCVLRFPTPMLDVIAEAIGARKRRGVTAEVRERLRNLSLLHSPFRKTALAA